MRRITPILVALTFVTAATRASRAAEPDAAALAALIDRHVEARLRAERVPPAGPADDAEFLRRVYLDLHGVVPTAEQAARFLADTRPDLTITCLDPVICPCSTMYRIHPAYLAWVLEELVEGRVVNQVSVAPEVADDARTALQRMLAVRP